MNQGEWRIRATFSWGLVVAALLGTIWPNVPSRVERHFSLGVYPRVQSALTAASNLVPFSWLDVIVLLAAAGALATAVVIGRDHSAAWRWLRGWAVTAAVVYLAFLAAWGLNYRREPLRGRMDFDAGRVTAARVASFASDAVDHVNAARLAAGAEMPSAAQDLEAMAQRLAGPFGAVCRRVGVPTPRLARPKVPVLSAFFTGAGVSGMTNPFGLETLVASNLLPFEQPAVIAHEWGHLAGFGPESEAAFLGTVTCLNGDASARYSAWLDITMHLVGAVSVAERRVLIRQLSPGVLRDIRAADARNERDRVRWLSLASWRVYDGYLKANRVPEGVRSYDEVTTLLVGTTFDERWLPRAR